MKNRPVSLFFRQFYITAKRFVMKPSLWILVILVGGFCMFIHTTEENEDPTSIIGYHIEDMGIRHDESDIIRDAIDEYEGYFTFEEFEDVDELENQVATTKISCGYVIPSDIYTKILDGDDDGIITTFVNADTTLEFLTNEIFFSLLFNEITSRELAANIMSEAGSADALYDAGIDEDYIRDTFLEYASQFALKGDFIFSSEILDKEDLDRLAEIKGSEGGSRIIAEFSPVSSSLNGLIAMIINIAAVFGVLDYYRERRNYLTNYIRFSAFSIIIPTFLLGIAGVICIILSGNSEGVLYEIAAMTCYCSFLCIINFLLCHIIRKPVIFYTLLPFYLMACFIFTPVIFNITDLIPALKPVTYLFLPNYYFKL